MQNTIINGANTSDVTFILAHGAGAGMDTPFMEQVAENLSAYGARVIRFEFPYMIKRRETGQKRPPDRADVLLSSFQEMIEITNARKLIIGGKSMGGRMASMIAAQNPQHISGCVCLGYPFHPPGKLDKLRLDHFSSLKTPTLICQGERDTFGTKNEVAGYDLPESVEMCWLGDGDHSFKPRKKSGLTLEQNITTACVRIAHKFINEKGSI